MVVRLNPALTLYTLRSVYIFSSLVSPHFMIRRDLFDNLEIVKLVIIFVIPLTFAYDSRLILWGELRSRSLLGSTLLHLYSRVPMSWTSCNKIQFYSLHIQRTIFPICLWNTMMLGSNICVSGCNRSTRFPRTPRCKRRKSKELNLFSEIFFIVAVAKSSNSQGLVSSNSPSGSFIFPFKLVKRI